MSTLKVNAITEADGTAFPFIEMSDCWLIDTSFNGNGEADITSNWARHSAGQSGQGTIGSAMTESSGIFTFPITGIYYIYSQLVVQANGGRSFIGMRQKFTTDGSNFTENSIAFTNAYANTAYASAVTSAVYDVTNTSTHKIKFQHNISDTVSVKGTSGQFTTGACFIRLGGT